MENTLKRLSKTNSLTYEELLFLLDNLNLQAEKLLFACANETRMKSYGKKVYLRALLEFSSYCKQTCLYCGLRCANTQADRYRLTREQIWELCLNGGDLGYQTFVLQSGEDDFYTDDLLEEIIRGLKERFPRAAVTLSIGEKSRESYQKYFAAGADRYLLRHETAARELYDRLHPGMSFPNRRKCLQDLKETGYQVGAGFIVGLPGQNNSVLAEDLLYLQELQPHMVGIGPFIAHLHTPLKHDKCGTVEKTFVCLALTRLLLPEALLPSTTALNVLAPDGLEKALQAGANVIMPNLAPAALRAKYELYKGRMLDDVEGAVFLDGIKQRIEQAGYEVDMGRGDHKNWSRQV